MNKLTQSTIDELINTSREADEGPGGLVRRVWAAALAEPASVGTLTVSESRCWWRSEVIPGSLPDGTYKLHAVKSAENDSWKPAGVVEVGAPPAAEPVKVMPLELADDEVRAIRNMFGMERGYTNKVIRKAFEWGVESARSQPATQAGAGDALVELEGICKAADSGAGGWVSTARLRELITAQPTEQPSQDAERLHKFLDAAAGEGLVLDGIDAADLYVATFPERYAARAHGEKGSA